MVFLKRMLYDNHNRPISYLRLAVTDRCNLRCQYCMPEEGIEYVSRNDLMSFEEMYRIVGILSREGITKVRITGGEPFVRRGMLSFLGQIKSLSQIQSLHITTNATMDPDIIPQLKKIGLDSVNISLDSLDRNRFYQITRRDNFERVWSNLLSFISHGIPIKLNMVVLSGMNIQDIVPMIELTKHMNLDVRFLEEMPFNGSGLFDKEKIWDSQDILAHIKQSYPIIEKSIESPHSTSINFQIPGYQGRFGIIASYSRLFCGSCNRIRLTPLGVLKTCLYDSGVFNIKELMRSGASDDSLLLALKEALSHRARDGFEAERRNLIKESMAQIGG